MKGDTTIVSVREPAMPMKAVPAADFAPYSILSFDEIAHRAKLLADKIEGQFEELTNILLEYESYEVVQDETFRTLDILRNLRENKKYFQLRVNEVASFLPRNQPLYAFTCFVIIPSFMAHKVHFRIPHSMRQFFPKLLELLDIRTLFPNIAVSHQGRLDFLTEHSALRVDPSTGESLPVTDAVIFTGTPAHADQLRIIFDNRTLFITNGAGHNPVVISKDADLPAALDAVLTLQLYNQGQDCAAPNTILVHKDIFEVFLGALREKLREVDVGHYRDRTNRVGPISDPRDLVRIEDLLTHNLKWIDPQTPGTVTTRDAILQPTIVNKPLNEGGNFNEIFAPIIYLQKYRGDRELALYFEDPRYAHNAMYVTVYGTSAYVSGLVGKVISGKKIHDAGTILHNTHLHARGIERGTQPYGGYGSGASSLSIHGKIVCKPTLPQRDIYEHVAKPLLEKKQGEKLRAKLHEFRQVKEKNVPKLLRLMNQEIQGQSVVSSAEISYIDVRTIARPKGRRYIRIDDKHTYHLLDKPNVEHAAKLESRDMILLRKLRTLLKRKGSKSLEEFSFALYALPNKSGQTERRNRAAQLRFFQHVYQLLFAKDHGPRLAQFLRETEAEVMLPLLDV
ncbi:MAG: hypothetical protein G01um10148_833 [Parcubacteria group bacterium Gr01-1014_8]|nr:MAG: hypothetical protein G01um10148_833 [Parcubacteria group bacterium Gr01-1014_8]